MAAAFEVEGTLRDGYPHVAEALGHLETILFGPGWESGSTLMDGGAAIYYQSPQITPLGQALPCAFPESSDYFPLEATCCSTNGLGGPDYNGNDLCDVYEFDWGLMESWAALNFSLSEETPFAFKYESTGSMGDAVASASAWGDLDCDGIQGTVSVFIQGDPDGGGVACDAPRTFPGRFHVTRATE